MNRVTGWGCPSKIAEEQTRLHIEYPCSCLGPESAEHVPDPDFAL